MANGQYLKHKRSSVVVNNAPKLPSLDKIDIGEIAINFAEGYETLSILNNNSGITTFSSDNTIYSAVSSYTTSLLDTKEDVGRLIEILNVDDELGTVQISEEDYEFIMSSFPLTIKVSSDGIITLYRYARATEDGSEFAVYMTVPSNLDDRNIIDTVTVVFGDGMCQKSGNTYYCPFVDASTVIPNDEILARKGSISTVYLDSSVDTCDVFFGPYSTDCEYMFILENVGTPITYLGIITDGVEGGNAVDIKGNIPPEIKYDKITTSVGDYVRINYHDIPEYQFSTRVSIGDFLGRPVSIYGNVDSLSGSFVTSASSYFSRTYEVTRDTLSSLETDPVFTNSPAYYITNQDITNWNNKQYPIGDLVDIRNNAASGASAATALTTHISDTSVHLPSVTAENNGKILQVVNGEWALVSPITVYTGQGTPSDVLGNNGDLYLETS